MNSFQLPPSVVKPQVGSPLVSDPVGRNETKGRFDETTGGEPEPYSDYRTQWGAHGVISRAERVAASTAKHWRYWNGGGHATRQTGRADWHAPCQYQDKWPQEQSEAACDHLRVVRREAQPPSAAGSVPVAVMPKHVAQCARNGGRGWSVWVWRHGAPDDLTRIQYTCESWRHEGDCSRAAAAQLFARLKEAAERTDDNQQRVFRPDGWVFFVLTLDRDGFYSGKPWPDAVTAYRTLGVMSRKYLKRLRRMAEKLGWTNPGSNWAAVVEAHKSGWPHINLLTYCPELAAYLRAEKRAKLENGATAVDASLLADDLSRHAIESGWGLRSTAEGARDVNAVSSYLVKLAGQADQHIGELAKLTQAPTNAPERFRRLRSGKGFLPPVRKNPAWTGALLRRYYDPQWGYIAQAFRGKKVVAPQRQEVLVQCEAIDSREFLRELEHIHEQQRLGNARAGPIIGPVSRWRNGVLTRPETFAEQQEQRPEMRKCAAWSDRNLANISG